ncbi:hypothetical protein IFM47457_10894 [Aspergillus lentulus]|nr:hypothetical protein IFM47457_10894 [Aspergillus lentulus]
MARGESPKRADTLSQQREGRQCLRMISPVSSSLARTTSHSHDKYAFQGPDKQALGYSLKRRRFLSVRAVAHILHTYAVRLIHHDIMKKVVQIVDSSITGLCVWNNVKEVIEH